MIQLAATFEKLQLHVVHLFILLYTYFLYLLILKK